MVSCVDKSVLLTRAVLLLDISWPSWTNVSPCRSQPAKSVEALLSERYDSLRKFRGQDKINSSIFDYYSYPLLSVDIVGLWPRNRKLPPEALTVLASQWGLGAGGERCAIIFLTANELLFGS